MNQQKALSYIYRIRNPHKRGYALAYWYYLTRGGSEPPRGHLSAMGAQSVSLCLRDFLKEA